MNNKEYISNLSAKVDMSGKDVSAMCQTVLGELTKALCDGDSVVVPNFGIFEVKKKLERVVVHPNTQTRMLVPPKMVVCFKPSTILKDKIK